MDLEQFILFNPVTGRPKEIPEGAGNYFVVIKEEHSLPDAGLPVVMAKFHGMDIVYTGVAGPSSGLRKRISWAHFGDNAGRSTLRLTLGVLMGFKPIPRDVSNPYNGHTRFRPEEEERLTDWMKGNLLVYFFPNDDYEAMEEELISSLNPPLNLMKNYNPVNSELRSHISYLRSQVQYGDIQSNITSIKNLLEKLSTPESLLDKPEVKFLNLAESLMNNFQIKKGNNRYWIIDIEFYIYTDSHRDIITYPRNCEAGRWFFHASGVDISFKSEVDSNARNLVRKPELSSQSVFGGILIRKIVMDGNPSIEADGPIKVIDELFDQFDALKAPENFPILVTANSPRNHSVQSSIRVGMKEEGKTKVPKILYNYSDWQIPEEQLIQSHDTYRMRSYRFFVDSK